MFTMSEKGKLPRIKTGRSELASSERKKSQATLCAKRRMGESTSGSPEAAEIK